MSDDPLPVAFPAPPDPAEEQRRARELDARLKLMIELARIATDRAMLHEGLAQRHQGYWLEDWERQKSQRLAVLARVLADPEMHAFIRGHAEFRRLFLRDMPPPVPKRARAPDRRKKRVKPHARDPVEAFFQSWTSLST